MYSCHRSRTHLFISLYFFTYEDVSLFCSCFLLSRDARILRASKSSIKMLLQSNDHPFNINPFKMNALFFCKSQWQGTGEVLFSPSIQFLYLKIFLSVIKCLECV